MFKTICYLLNKKNIYLKKITVKKNMDFADYPKTQKVAQKHQKPFGYDAINAGVFCIV